MPAIASTSKHSEEDWEARNGFDTLVRAHEISANPTLMKRIKAHAKKHEEKAKRVSRLEGKLL